MTFYLQRQIFMKWPTASNLKIDAGDGNLTLYVGLDADVLVYETGPRCCHRNPNIAKTLKEISHWRKLSMIMVWERYCNASQKPEFFLFSLFIFSFISQLIWVRLGWNFHRRFSIQKQLNWCTIDSFSLKFCTSQHSYPVPLIIKQWHLHGCRPCQGCMILYSAR